MACLEAVLKRERVVAVVDGCAAAAGDDVLHPVGVAALVRVIVAAEHQRHLVTTEELQ